MKFPTLVAAIAASALVLGLVPAVAQDMAVAVLDAESAIAA